MVPDPDLRQVPNFITSKAHEFFTFKRYLFRHLYFLASALTLQVVDVWLGLRLGLHPDMK